MEGRIMDLRITQGATTILTLIVAAVMEVMRAIQQVTEVILNISDGYCSGDVIFFTILFVVLTRNLVQQRITAVFSNTDSTVYVKFKRLLMLLINHL